MSTIVYEVNWMFPLVLLVVRVDLVGPLSSHVCTAGRGKDFYKGRVGCAHTSAEQTQSVAQPPVRGPEMVLRVSAGG